MKKLITIALAIVLVLVLCSTAVVAQDSPNASAKATAQIQYLDVMSVAYTTEPNDVTDIFDLDYDLELLEQTIKTANDKDLFIDVSLQSAVFTGTTVKSKNMNRDTSAAAAAVVLRVVIDEGTANEIVAFPGVIVYNARLQVLTAKLQGVIPTEWPGTITIPEEIGLFIGTMSANSFNFIVADLSSGMHTVTVQAACVSWVMNQQGCAQAVAVIGLGSMTVEEVRMVKGENAIILPD